MGILGEYDALSSLSQKAASPRKEPVEAGGARPWLRTQRPGHRFPGRRPGCKGISGGKQEGRHHHLLRLPRRGRRRIQAVHGPGRACSTTWILYTPGTQPPSTPWNAITATPSWAQTSSLKASASHAGGSPHLGRSALDAVELMNVGCNYLREHMIPEARIHYAYIDAGGTAPNVVQDHAVIRYEVRSPWVSQVKDLFERVKNVARGASIMTDTTCGRASLPWPSPNISPTTPWPPLPTNV